MDLWPIALALFAGLVVRLAVQWLQMWRVTRDGMPSIMPIPLFGVNVFKLLSHVKELHVPILRDVLHFGLIHRAWYYTHQMIVVCDPDELSVLLNKDFESFDRSRHEREGFGELLGDGMLLVQNGESWKRARNTLTPMFHRKSLKGLHDQMAKNGEVLLKRISTLNGEPIDIQAEFQKLTFDTIAKLTLGIDLNSQTSTAESEFGRAWRLIFYYLHLRFFSPLPYWLQDLLPLPGQRAYRDNLAKLRRMVDDAIEARRKVVRAASAAGGGEEEPSDDFLGFLLHEQRRGIDISNEYIRNELITLLFAGHDTTTNLLTWAIFYLATDPVRLRILQSELDQQLQGRVPSFEQLAQLRYLRFVVKETLRLQPAAALRSRTLTKDTAIAKWSIPAGTDVLWSPWVLHRVPCLNSLRSALWPEPLAFRPERFDPDSPHSQTLGNNHPYAYLPFGGGPRRCIGEPLAMQEASLVLAMVLQQYDPFLAPNQDIRPALELTLRAEYGLKIHFSRRKRT